jgi:PTS system ascorbate-specific IIA component
MNTILLIAHAPLASALRAGALHVFPDAGEHILALDVQADAPPEVTQAQARTALAGRAPDTDVLVLTDVLGATPCNVARQLTSGGRLRLLAGANLPMLLRAVSYRHEPLDSMAEKAQAGGVQGIVPVESNP